jgi:hypothetical protein
MLTPHEKHEAANKSTAKFPSVFEPYQLIRLKLTLAGMLK